MKDEHLFENWNHKMVLAHCEVKGCGKIFLDGSDKALIDKHMDLTHKPKEAPAKKDVLAETMKADVAGEEANKSIFPAIVDRSKTQMITNQQQEDIGDEASLQRTRTLLDRSGTPVLAKTKK